MKGILGITNHWILVNFKAALSIWSENEYSNLYPDLLKLFEVWVSMKKFNEDYFCVQKSKVFADAGLRTTCKQDRKEIFLFLLIFFYSSFRLEFVRLFKDVFVVKIKPDYIVLGCSFFSNHQICKGNPIEYGLIWCSQSDTPTKYFHK